MSEDRSDKKLFTKVDEAILRSCGDEKHKELTEERANCMVADCKDKTDQKDEEGPKNLQDDEGKIDLDGPNYATQDHVQLGDTNARYAAYTAVLARTSRYLAFTSDFGEALRPVVKASIVKASYGVSLGYCVADVCWEAHKLRQNNFHTDAGNPMSMAQCVVERATFQAVASVALPFAVIHSAVDLSRKLFARIKSGRFSKWGPSIVGLSVIPLLPMYLDEPVEEAVEFAFRRYGPWASPTVQQEHRMHPHRHSAPGPAVAADVSTEKPTEGEVN